MTSIVLSKREPTDPEKVLKGKVYHLKKNNPNAAKKITGWGWPIKKVYRKMEGRIDPFDAAQINRFLLYEVYPNFGLGVYKLIGVVDGIKGLYHFGTFAVYGEGHQVNVCSWASMKERLKSEGIDPLSLPRRTRLLLQGRL